MLYVGNDTIIHSGGHAPSAYSSIGPKVNDYGVSTAKYHLESKADIIDTESGTFEVSTDKFGTVKESSFSKALKGYINRDVSNKVLTILRPINEVVNNSNISLSKNAENRLKKPRLSLTKKASVENALAHVITGENDSAFCATKIQDFLWKDGEPLNFDATNVPRSQDIEPIYRETSGVYVFTKEVFKKYHRRIGKHPYVCEVSFKEAVDINNPEDFQLAEALLNWNI